MLVIGIRWYDCHLYLTQDLLLSCWLEAPPPGRGTKQTTPTLPSTQPSTPVTFRYWEPAQLCCSHTLDLQVYWEWTFHFGQSDWLVSTLQSNANWNLKLASCHTKQFACVFDLVHMERSLKREDDICQWLYFLSYTMHCWWCLVQGDEKRIYEYVVRHFLACCSQVCI